MADEGQTKWELDLDTSDAAESIDHLGAKLGELSDPASLAGFVEMFAKIGTVVGVVGASIFALKESIDLVFDAEKVEAINQQFQILAENTGLAADELREGMEKASNGMISENEMLQEANRAMLALGSSARALPEIMALARIQSVATGQSFKDTFDILARGLETGNARLLRQAGIVVDQRKALKDYADSIGVTVELLSRQGQQQAIINAVLEQSKSKMAGVNDDVLKATNAWQQFKAAMSDVGDTLTIFYDKTAGPIITKMMQGMASFAHSVKETLVENLGSGAEQAELRMKSLSKEMERVNGLIAKYGDASKLTGNAKIGYDMEVGSLKRLQAEYDHYAAKIHKVSQEKQADGQKTEAEQKAQIARDSVDQDRQAQLREKYHAQLVKLKEEEVDLEIRNATSVAEVDHAFADKRQLLIQQMAAEQARIDREYGTHSQMAAQMKVQLEMNTAAKIRSIDQELLKAREASLDEYSRRSQSLSEGISRGFEAGSKKQQLELKNFGKIGQQTFDTFGKQAVTMFKSMGDGSKSASEAMAGFVLGAIGEMAMNYGEMLLLSGIWPPNPLALGAGAGLIALGGFLESKAGGSSSGGGGGGGGGGGSAGSAPAVPQPPALSTDSGPSMDSASPQHNIQFVVQGNLYSSNEAKMEMMQMMRDATDATAYKYTEVGNS